MPLFSLKKVRIRGLWLCEDILVWPSRADQMAARQCQGYSGWCWLGPALERWRNKFPRRQHQAPPARAHCSFSRDQATPRPQHCSTAAGHQLHCSVNIISGVVVWYLYAADALKWQLSWRVETRLEELVPGGGMEGGHSDIDIGTDCLLKSG